MKSHPIFEKDRFKLSTKSICHQCSNIHESCFDASKRAGGSDPKSGTSFIDKCGSFNKPIEPKKYEKNMVSVDSVADTRIEMMGGGFKELEK